MTQPLAERVQTFLELDSQRTPGPWHLMDEGFGKANIPTLYATDDQLRFIAKFADFCSGTDNLANARFVYAAANEAPAIIREQQAEIERLEARIKELDPYGRGVVKTSTEF